MSRFKNDAIQVAEYEYDFAVDGGASGAFNLSAKANKAAIPTGAVLVGHEVLVQTTLAGSGASAKIGTTNDDNEYLVLIANPAAGVSTAYAANTPKLVADGDGDVIMASSGGVLTAGKLKVLVHFVNPNG